MVKMICLNIIILSYMKSDAAIKLFIKKLSQQNGKISHSLDLNWIISAVLCLWGNCC